MLPEISVSMIYGHMCAGPQDDSVSYRRLRSKTADATKGHTLSLEK